MSRFLQGALFVSLLAGCPPDGGGPSDAGPDAAGPTDAGFDFGYGCHWDCFGGSVCADGVVRTAVYMPVPCERWTGMCPVSVSYTCAHGCRTDVTYTPHPYGGWTMCEEFRIRAVGDACTADVDCQYLTMIGDRISRLHLACVAGACADAPAPTVADWLAPCAAAAAIPVDPADGASQGALADATCSGGVCVYSEQPTCIESACTLPCADDWDCPDDSTCDRAGAPIPVDGGAPSAGACRPSFGTALECR